MAEMAGGEAAAETVRKTPAGLGAVPPAVVTTKVFVPATALPVAVTFTVMVPGVDETTDAVTPGSVGNVTVPPARLLPLIVIVIAGPPAVTVVTPPIDATDGAGGGAAPRSEARSCASCRPPTPA